ncbi:unnamed protein product [Porites evermanni]|uniref:Uncharacterized protein n=1 Tax=Porites evermanni TaxID=104178 RepID=A0ABN8LLB5_9CNID|nr:unnamed protein product [Porites evermanni]
MRGRRVRNQITRKAQTIHWYLLSHLRLVFASSRVEVGVVSGAVRALLTYKLYIMILTCIFPLSVLKRRHTLLQSKISDVNSGNHTLNTHCCFWLNCCIFKFIVWLADCLEEGEADLHIFMSVSNRIEATEVKDIIATGKRSQVPRSFATNRLDQVFNIYDLEVILNTVSAVYFTL